MSTSLFFSDAASVSWSRYSARPASWLIATLRSVATERPKKTAFGQFRNKRQNELAAPSKVSVPRETTERWCTPSGETRAKTLCYDDLDAERHELVDTALWPLVPEEWVPMDLGHAVTRMAGRCEIGQHVHKARQGLVSRVNTPSVRTSVVLDADVVETLVSNDRDPVYSLKRANGRV